MTADFDVVVIGGGPAGLACATTARTLGLQVIVVEAHALGGQLVNVAALDSDQPLADAQPGAMGWDIAATLTERAQDHGVVIEFGSVERLVEHDGGWEAGGQGVALRGRSVVVATGTVPPPLAVEGASRFEGRGISTCAACDGPLFAGSDVVVLGGGPVSEWEVAHLAAVVAHITVLDPTGDGVWTDPAFANIVAVRGDLECIEGDDVVTAIRYRSATGAVHRLEARAIFNALDRVPAPPTGMANDVASDGSIIVGTDLAASRRGLFAAGEVRAGAARRLAAAIDDGQRAAHAVAQHLSQH